MKKTYAIDGNNVCWWYSQSHPREISISPLLTILTALLVNNDDFYCVFDATICYTFENCGKGKEAQYIQSLITQDPRRFFRVTGATRADGVLLHYADHNNRCIITNDIFKDYRDRYSWLEERFCPRLIQGNLQPNGLLTLERLAYGQLKILSNLSKIVHNFEKVMRGDRMSDQKSDKNSNNENFIKTPPNNDQTRIAMTTQALSYFLLPYNSKIPFYGPSWKIAVKILELFFKAHKICTNCYCVNSNSNEFCSRCDKQELTNNPHEIWKIVFDHGPENFHELDNLILNSFEWLYKPITKRLLPIYNKFYVGYKKHSIR